MKNTFTHFLRRGSISFILLVIVLACSGSYSRAQFCGGGTLHGDLTGSMTTSFNTVTGTGGTYAYWTFTATAGVTYTFTTCGLISSDTYLRLYSGTNPSTATYVTGSDDACGLQSNIVWICPSSGNYSIHLSQYSCNALYGNTNMQYMSNAVLPACSGTPTAGTTTSSANPVCSGINFTLNVSGATSGVSGLTYQWQSSTDGISYANISGAASSTLTTSQTSATYYKRTITCTGFSTTSTPLFVTMNPPSSCYCTPGISTYPCTYDWISNVTTTLGATNFNNSTGCAATSYTNYSGSISASQVQGSVVNMSFTAAGYSLYFSVYIDYNDDGDFVDAGETVINNFMVGPFATGGTFTDNTNFTVDPAAPAGTHRMRVRGDYYYTITGPCTTLYEGETEDYAFTVIVPVACSGTPTGGTTASSANPVCSSTTSFTLSTTGSTVGASGLTYQWQQSVDGTTFSNISGATSATYATTLAATPGPWFRRVITCSTSGLSANSTPIQITIGLTAVCYCTSMPTTTADEEIYTVTVNGSSTPSAYSAAAGCTTAAPGPGSILSRYSNFTTLSPLSSVVQGATTSISVYQDECDAGFYYANGIAAFADWNHDGDFVDAGETMWYDGTVTAAGPRTVSGTFLVPGAALLGNTVMRVICAEGYAGSTITPCLNSYGYGETEDYLITVTPPAPPTVTSFTPTSSCAGSTVTITGTNLGGATAVTFGGIAATSFTPLSSTTITAVAPAGASGVICVTNSAGTGCSAGTFTTIATPAPTAVTATPSSVCQYVTTSLSGTSSSGNINWYTAATGGTFLGNSASGAGFSVTPTTVGTVTYYAEGSSTGSSSGNMLSSPVPANSGSGSWTLGYEFTPSSNMVVTAVRSYFGSKVSVWTAGGTLVFSQAVAAAPGSWTNTALPASVTLTAGTTYRIGAFTNGGSYNWSYGLPATYANGTLQSGGGYEISGDAFPSSVDAVNYWFVDLAYSIPGSCPSTTRTPVSVTVNAAPTISVTPTSANYCNPGTAVSMTASGAGGSGTYNWSPGTGLSGTSGASVTASPGSTTTYTVTGTDLTSGCSNTATTTITPVTGVTVSASATPATICSGSTSGLLATASAPSGIVSTYGFSTTGSSSLATLSSPTSIVAANVDDAASAVTTIGFTFNYEGTAYTQFSASSNGLMRLGSAAVSTGYTNATTTTGSEPNIMPLWDDQTTGTDGGVSYQLLGIAPNRQLVVQWHTCVYPSYTSFTMAYQVVLNETSNTVEFRYGTGVSLGSASVGAGGSTATNYNDVNTATHVNSTTAVQDANTAWPGSGRKYTFTPTVLSYLWDNAGTLSSATISNPVATPATATTYTVTVSASSTGCSNTASTTVNVTSPASGSFSYTGTPYCSTGGTATTTPSSLTAGGTYSATPAGLSLNATTGAVDLGASTAGTYTVTYTVAAGTCPAYTTSASITINGAIAFSLQPADATTCDGSGFTLSVNAPGATGYQWYGPSGLIAGETSSSYSIGFSTAADGGVYYAVAFGSAPCGSVTSNNATVMINPPGTWLGITSDWSDPANWCGGVPTASGDVIIPSTGSTPFDPVVLGTTTANVHNINIMSSSVTVNGTMNLYGDVTLSPTGTFAASMGMVNFAGSSAQNILPGFVAGTLMSTGGGNKTLNGNVTVANNLTLTSGNVVLNSSDLTLQPGATITGGSPASYVRTNGTGSELVQQVGATPVTFPVGNTNFNPVTMNNTGTTDNFRVHVRDEVLVSGTTGMQVDNTTTYAINHTFDIEEDVLGGSVANITLQWGAGEENTALFQYNHAYIAHFYDNDGAGPNPAEWHHDDIPYSSMAPAAGGWPGPGPYTAATSNVTTFSPFAIGSNGGSAPLHVQLTDVSAVNEGAKNKVEWHSAVEDGLDHYEVERSTDGQHFSHMADVAAAGHAFGYLTYDNSPNPGLTYYRLKLVEQDGTSSYSQVVHAFMKVGNEVAVAVYPNPVSDVLHVEVFGATDDATVILTDLSGKVIAPVTLHNGQAEINMSSLSSGVYFVKFSGNGLNQSIKVNKQ